VQHASDRRRAADRRPAHAPPVGRPPAGRRYFKRAPCRQWSPVSVPRIGERERWAITEAHALELLACPVQMWRTAERLLPESARAAVSLADPLRTALAVRMISATHAVANPTAD